MLSRVKISSSKAMRGVDGSHSTRTHRLTPSSPAQINRGPASRIITASSTGGLARVERHHDHAFGHQRHIGGYPANTVGREQCAAVALSQTCAAEKCASEFDLRAKFAAGCGTSPLSSRLPAIPDDLRCFRGSENMFEEIHRGNYFAIRRKRVRRISRAHLPRNPGECVAGIPFPVARRRLSYFSTSAANPAKAAANILPRNECRMRTGKLRIDQMRLLFEVNAHARHQLQIVAPRCGRWLRATILSRETGFHRADQLFLEAFFVHSERRCSWPRSCIKLRMRSSIVTPADGTSAGMEVTMA